jgi:hypothetical protein
MASGHGAGEGHRWSGERVSEDVLNPWNVAKIRRELGHVVHVAALVGCPGIQDLGDGVDEGFVVGENADGAPLQHVQKMANGGDACEELSVEG